MAMTQCSECGHNLSDKAAACPNCGCPIADPDENFNAVHITISTIITLAGLIIGTSGISKAGWIVFIIGLCWFIGARLLSKNN